MTINDTINSSIIFDPVTGLPTTAEELAEKNRARLAQQQMQMQMDLAQQNNKKQSDALSLLLALFLNEKLAGRKDEASQDAPLTENEDFIAQFSSSLGIDRKAFAETARKVRSGELSALDAAKSTLASAPPSSLDLANAEKVVAKFAKQGNPLLELIASKESGGNYNITYGGKMMPLTDMTVDQVIAWQERRRREGVASTACGKYQIIWETLKGLKSELAAKGQNIGSMKFDANTQDHLAKVLMDRRGYSDYMAGRLDETTFMTRLSKEWASLPKDMGGKSFYHGDGLNKAHINPAVLLVAMRTAKSDVGGSDLMAQFAKGGVAEKSATPGNPSVAFNRGGTDQVALAKAKAHATVAIAKASIPDTSKPTNKPV